MPSGASSSNAIVRRSHALRDNIATLGIADRCTVHVTDVMAWVPAMRNVDIAFIDPPYAFDAWPALLALVDVGLVVAEADDPVDAPEGWDAAARPPLRPHLGHAAGT